MLVFELKDEPSELETLIADEITIVNDQRFTWKGREKLNVRQGSHKFDSGYELTSYVQVEPPVAATSLDLRSDWRLYALGTSYGFFLYDYANKHSVVNKCTLNVQDYAIVSGDASGAGTISRKKSFRKSLRESFRRLRRGRSQRNQQLVTGSTSDQATKSTFGRVTTGVRALNAPSGPDSSNIGPVHRNLYSTERQVEQKIELSSIVKCITLTSAVITSNPSFKPSLWVGTNSGQVLVYAINLVSEKQQQKGEQVAVAVPSEQPNQDSTPTSANEQQAQLTTARLAKEIQLKHKAPIIAIFTTPDEPLHSNQNANVSELQNGDNSVKSTPEKQPSDLLNADNKSEQAQDQKSQNEAEAVIDGERPQTPAASPPAAPQQQDGRSPSAKSKDKETVQQPRVLICSEEQFKVFNLPNLKPFCKFKLTAHEGLRAKKISITQFLKPASNKQQTASASAALSASKSLQSFATQTSPPASPLPPADGGQQSDQALNSANKQAESNNNSLSTLNNNHTSKQQENSSSKELMNAKFGAAKSNSSATHQAENQKDQLADLSNVEGSGASLFEPYMVCMSNQGDCAIYSVPDLKRQAQIQVCKREDVNGITSTMLTNYGEGYYLKSSSNFLRFSISTQRVLRVLSVV